MPRLLQGNEATSPRNAKTLAWHTQNAISGASASSACNARGSGTGPAWPSVRGQIGHGEAHCLVNSLIFKPWRQRQESCSKLKSITNTADRKNHYDPCLHSHMDTRIVKRPPMLSIRCQEKSWTSCPDPPGLTPALKGTKQKQGMRKA